MPRFLIAATHKSSGKTVISTGLAVALSGLGHRVQTFKKGPDYIDPMWLSAASGRPCYNLDFNLMRRDELLDFYAAHAPLGDLRLIEANKGLFDGVATDGSDANAELARILQAPVVLVVDSSGMTRGIAPLLQGYLGFEPGLNIAGVILNKVAGARHEGKLVAAVRTYTDLPVLGAIRRDPALEIGERHLGLTTPAESAEMTQMIAGFGAVMTQSVDLGALQSIAGSAPDLALKPASTRPLRRADIKIGIAQDTAFGFYYPDDLEAFANEGAELVKIDMLQDRSLPRIDGLFIGGGFPETQMQKLAANTAMKASLRRAITAGLPTYAECGGLMYLCQTLSWNGTREDMVGVIPAHAKMCARPQGRGYVRFEQCADHPWGRGRADIKAHEFHYARINDLPDSAIFARTLTRGAGIRNGQDAVVIHNLVAGFCHLRSSRTFPWVRDFVAFVRAKKS